MSPEQAPQGYRVFGGISIAVVVEIDPGFFCPACSYPIRQVLQFFL